MDPILTVFTPAYNRAHTLVRTYQSLCNQSCKDFIWLIVDDGSTDQTAQLVRDWQSKENGFSILYLYKENGGMHTAHNLAYEAITTELNICIDSDDRMPPEAVEKILNKWESLRGSEVAGIMGLDADFTGNIIGGCFPDSMKESTVSGYYAQGGTGDKKLVYRTDIINSYPAYPVFEGEKYISLAYKYLLIDQDYKMAILNDVLCEVEYQEDGSSNTMWRNYLQNPRGWQFWRKIRMKYDTSFKRRLIDCVGYCSSSQLANKKGYITQSPNKLMTMLCSPLGHLLTWYVREKVKQLDANE